MSELTRTSAAYLGPEKGRWAPASWEDLQKAAAGGLLDETHWVELKREIPTTKGANAELARDLASLAVDGGLLAVGIADDGNGTGEVVGVELNGLAERVEQVAGTKVHPPLFVRTTAIPDPDAPSRGCLLVHVPASGQAPHMVDHVYYGRGDKTKIKLADAQVRAILVQRHAQHVDVLAEVRCLAKDDPIPERQRRRGHLYVLAHPTAGREDALVELLEDERATLTIRAAINQVLARRDRRFRGFTPDLDSALTWARRADGLAHVREVSKPEHDDRLIELVVRENGGVGLICGRGTEYRLGSENSSRSVVIPQLVVGLVHGVVALAGTLADQHSGYQGQWQIGVYMDCLRGAEPSNRLHDWVGNPYSRDEYTRATSACTAELVDAPDAVADRLVAPLLRGLGVAHLYRPAAS